MRIQALKKMLYILNPKTPEESSAKVIIDCAAQPFIPEDCSVKEHQIGDRQHQFNPDEISFYQSKKLVTMDGLIKELEGHPVLNVNVLDYLLTHQQIIPEHWQKKLIFFLGTIYYNSKRSPFVRYMGWNGSAWYSGDEALFEIPHSGCYAIEAIY